LAANCAGLAMATAVADRATARFFADFDIEMLRSVGGGHRAATTEAPRRPNGAGGDTILPRQDSGFAEPADHVGKVEESVYVGNDFFEAAGNFNGLSGSSGARADLGCLGDSKPYLKLGPHKGKRSLNRRIKANGIHGVPPFGTTHACCAREVERNVSNLMAHLAQAGSYSDGSIVISFQPPTTASNGTIMARMTMGSRCRSSPC